MTDYAASVVKLAKMSSKCTSRLVPLVNLATRGNIGTQPRFLVQGSFILQQLVPIAQKLLERAEPILLETI